jgi:hypothetical protein
VVEQNATLKPTTFEVRHENLRFSFCLPHAVANATEPFRIRFGDIRLLATLSRGRPSISVRQQTGNRNERPLSGRLTLPGNDEDGRRAVVRSLYVRSV